MAYLNKATKELTAQLRLKGGVGVRTLTGNVTCDAGTENFCSWDPGGASRDVTLPAEESSNGLFFLFVNEADAAENLVIKNDGGSTIVTINQNEWAIVACTGSAWFDVPMSALADYLATANSWSALQTFAAGLAITTIMNRAAGASTAAAGSTFADAGALPAGTASVYPTTGADGTKGVIVNVADKVTGRTINIGNGVSNQILKVYGPSGASINGSAADAAFSSASGKGVVMYCLSSGANTWLAW